MECNYDTPNRVLGFECVVNEAVEINGKKIDFISTDQTTLNVFMHP